MAPLRLSSSLSTHAHACRDSVIQAYRSKRLSRLAKLGHSTEHLSVRGATPATLKDLVGRTGKGGADGGE